VWIELEFWRWKQFNIGNTGGDVFGGGKLCGNAHGNHSKQLYGKRNRHSNGEADTNAEPCVERKRVRSANDQCAVVYVDSGRRNHRLDQ
jgi:hypothetical protein